MVEFGEQLRKAREAKGMTQQSLAEQLYVTRQSVPDGSVEHPKQKDIKK